MEDALLYQHMRVAITIFGSTISPLFDAAQKILFVDLEAGKIRKRFEKDIGGLDPAQRLGLLVQHNVQLLICGAISSFMQHALGERGLQVYPWIAGEREEVLRCLALRFGTEEGGDRPFRLAVAVNGANADAQICQSFRGCSHFLLFNERGEGCGVIKNNADSTSARGGCCNLAYSLITAKVQVLLTQRCGPNALGMLTAAGIQTVLGVEGMVQEVVQSYLRAERPEPEPGGPTVRLGLNAGQREVGQGWPGHGGSTPRARPPEDRGHGPGRRRKPMR